MAWWISSAVCSFTLISKLYDEKELLLDKDLHKPVGYLISIIFCIMILFGGNVIYDLGKIEDSLYRAFIIDCDTFDVPNIEHIFTLIKKLYALSSTTNATFLLIWLYIWFYKPIKKI